MPATVRMILLAMVQGTVKLRREILPGMKKKSSLVTDQETVTKLHMRRVRISMVITKNRRVVMDKDNMKMTKDSIMMNKKNTKVTKNSIKMAKNNMKKTKDSTVNLKY